MARSFSYEAKGKGTAVIPSQPEIPRVRAPSFDNSALMKKHALTVIGRVTNPSAQRIWALIPFLADHWKLSSRPVGADLGQGLFQLQFSSEQDLVKALENQPYHFSQWMVILQRWEPTTSRSFPSQIPFWIYIQGIPVHLWSDEILESIAKNVDHLEKTEVSPTYFRMRVTVNGLKPLIKKTIVEFGDGSEVVAELIYDKLQKHCKMCCLLDHEEKDCPSNRDKRRHGEDSVALNRPSENLRKDGRETLRHREIRDGRSFRDNKGGYQAGSSQRLESRDASRDEAYPDERRRVQRNGTEYHRGFRREDSRRSLSRTQNHRDDYPEGQRSRREFQGRDSFSLGGGKEGSWRIDVRAEAFGSHHGVEVSCSSKPRREEVNRGTVIPQDVRPLPQAVVEEAMGELREVMIQYASCPDPTESAARRERVRQAEEQGQFIETAEQMVRASLPTQASPPLLWLP